MPDLTKFMKGPGDLYVGITIPADGALVAIAANAKLDTSVHTGALAIASTEAGVKFTAKPEMETEKIDEVPWRPFSRDHSLEHDAFGKDAGNSAP